MDNLPLRTCLFVAIWIASACGNVAAQTFVWNGSGPDQNWSTASNWGGTMIPVSGVDTRVEFAGANGLAPFHDLGSFTLNELIFTDVGFIVTGDDLVFVQNSSTTDPSISQDAAAFNEFSNNLTFNDDLTVSGTADLVHSGVAAGLGSLNLFNLLTINNQLNNTGNINVLSGSARLEVNGTVGNGGDIILSVANNIGVSGSGTINRNVTLNNGGAGLSAIGLTINGDLNVNPSANGAKRIFNTVNVNGGTFINATTSTSSLNVFGTLGGTGAITIESNTDGSSGSSLAVFGNIASSKAIFVQNRGAMSGDGGTINGKVTFQGRGSITPDSTAATMTFNGPVCINGSEIVSVGNVDGDQNVATVDFNETLSVVNGELGLVVTLGGSGDIVVEPGGTISSTGLFTNTVTGNRQIVLQGKMQLLFLSVIDATVEMQGGEIQFGSNNSGNVINGDINSIGTSEIFGGDGFINGQLTIGSGSLEISGTRLRTSGTGTIVLSDGATLLNEGEIQLPLVAQGVLDGSSGGDFTAPVILETATVCGSLNLTDTLTVQTNGPSVIDDAAFVVVEGATVVSEGSLVVNSTADLVGIGDVHVETGASITVNGLVDKNMNVLEGASLAGDGKITGDVSIEGTVQPGNSAGTLDIDGCVVLTKISTTMIEVGGTKAGFLHDQINSCHPTVPNPLLLAGTLGVSLIDNYYPVNSDNFTIFRNFAVQGSFDNVVDGRLDLGDGTSFAVELVPGDLNGSDNVVLCDFQPGLGDINGDGFLNLLDVGPFIKLLGAGAFVNRADINRDGAVNLLDVKGFILLVSGQ